MSEELLPNPTELDPNFEGPTFKRAQDTPDYQAPGSEENRENKSWQAVRDECRSGGAMDERCNIIAAANGTGKLEVVAKRLSCGCILILEDSDEVGL